MAVLVKWFPERRGLITGVAVGGFGAGSLLAAPAAGWLMQNVGRYAYLRVSRYCLRRRRVCSGFFMRNPPEGWKPAGLGSDCGPNVPTIRSRLYPRRSFADLAMVGPLRALVDQYDRGHIGGFPSVADVSGTGQGKRCDRRQFRRNHQSGQRCWDECFGSWISDLIGRKGAFFAMYLIQAILFWTFHDISSPIVLLVVSFVILVCYGGAYGITPAFAADYFGPRHVGPIFGLMLLPWAFPAALARSFSPTCGRSPAAIIRRCT